MREVTDHELDAAVEGGGLVLVEVWATFCPARASYGAIIAELVGKAGDRRRGRIEHLCFTIDGHDRLPAGLRVRGVPMLVCYRDGRQTAKLPGVHAKRFLGRWIEDVIRLQR